MIEHIHIYPRYTVERLLDRPETIPTSYVEGGWALISVYTEPQELLLTDAHVELLKTKNCSVTMTEQFYDIFPETLENEGFVERFPNAVRSLFNETQAKHIYDFLVELNKLDNVKTLVVHCDAGISRSGAIGAFATDLYKKDYMDYMATNPNVMPNYFVYKTLCKVSGLDQTNHGTEPSKAIEEKWKHLFRTGAASKYKEKK